MDQRIAGASRGGGHRARQSLFLVLVTGSAGESAKRPCHEVRAMAQRADYAGNANERTMGWTKCLKSLNFICTTSRWVPALKAIVSSAARVEST